MNIDQNNEKLERTSTKVLNKIEEVLELKIGYITDIVEKEMNKIDEFDYDWDEDEE
jgi:hypothetical protein